jgi:hypothetical protein
MKTLKANDNQFLKGKFKLSLIDINSNEVTQTIEDDNLIVNTSFDILSGLLSTADSKKKINRIALGDGGIYNNEILVPHPNDNELQSEKFRKTIKKVTTSTILDRAITFHFDITPHEGNGLGGVIYNEAGLMSEDGTLFARKTFENIIKSRDFLIRIEWTIKFL